MTVRKEESVKLLNIKFNADKIKYKQNEIKYLGMILYENGTKPDLERMQAITELKKSYK